MGPGHDRSMERIAEELTNVHDADLDGIVGARARRRFVPAYAGGFGFRPGAAGGK
jgi:hypothetical protein